MNSTAYQLAPVGLCYLDRAFRYLEINEWLARLNGLTVEQHLGRTIHEVVPDVARGIVEQLDRVAETQQPIVNGRVVAKTTAHPNEERNYDGRQRLRDIGDAALRARGAANSRISFSGRSTPLGASESWLPLL